jgi:hypothetical protein
MNSRKARNDTTAKSSVDTKAPVAHAIQNITVPTHSARRSRRMPS